ncbi:hypothetical protein [Pseudomonas frederiksbergensis]|uniref:Uncharacterized protein n=1 Tax=Pseudomonas frederiksbergensis TaxID=104087 RepID=A0A423KKP1_9PSED|nr:hypothetical protein [Pseudomonas frederiksbergensis]RON53964.1 hypothetical protein BK665_13775 [Pseudomonas frederiksbergensis]
MSNFTPAASLSSGQYTVSHRQRLAPSTRQSCCTASDAGGAQANALAAMSALSTSCANAINVVNQNPLGRYSNDGSCSYDCGFKEQDWNWWADYRPTNTNLAQRVGGMDIASPYNAAFQPTQQWLNPDLPNYATQINANLASITQIDAAIAASGSETPEQSAQLNNAFASLANVLQSNLNEANQALQNLASFLSWEQGPTSNFPAYVDGCKSYIQQSATTIKNNLIGDIACGSGDVQNTFNAMFADIATKFANMQPGFNDVSAKLQTAFAAGDAVTGVFLVLQSDSQLVSGQIVQAQNYPPASALRTLHLNIAANEWASFVQEANTQFQAG